MLRVKLVRSLIGNNERNRRTVASLGLRRMHQIVFHQDNPTIRGMIHKVKHMLVVDEVDASEAPNPRLKPGRTLKAKAAPKPKTAARMEVSPVAALVAKPKAASPKPKAESPKPKAVTTPKPKAKSPAPKAASKKETKK